MRDEPEAKTDPLESAFARPIRSALPQASTESLCREGKRPRCILWIQRAKRAHLVHGCNGATTALSTAFRLASPVGRSGREVS